MYQPILDQSCFERNISVVDHLDGFSADCRNHIFDHIQAHCSKRIAVDTTYLYFENCVKDHYPLLELRCQPVWVFADHIFENYRLHPNFDPQHFVCSFNGSPHISRKLLVSILNRFGWFDPEVCSKNFIYDTDNIYGHICENLQGSERFYSKFFMADFCEDFFQTVYSFGLLQYDHKKNILNLENRITSSFLHIVSETMATSYYPFFTEKFLYSVVTRGLFLSYAQPNWHDHLEKYFGFRKYDKIFDYRFDEIKNPIERLVELMSMISKFSVLSSDDWRDLYEMEKDTIEYNYDHYFSKAYLKSFK